ncbi:dihydrolipoyl dehydrogenase [Myroides sp. WP-1]|uniref:dihydrolipoyl dehydrogenase n=1 Tax=Myroides sp. WP-1 TaxID=2759944 RepID=UPI0015FBFE79|nr:dihydrolipoyl dehydrogenase [Myroides sp. WP-1]MBB1138199.1 dihydrolipoyl dehydrogenase [Myroides sp. WP-1]
MEKFDLVVIGSGPGGYVAAIRAAQLGYKTALIEKYNTLGGTCTNVGCIPTKALLDSTHHYADILTKFSKQGIEIQGVHLNFSQMYQRKEEVIQKNTQGLTFLMQKNKITTFYGIASFTSNTTLTVTTSEGEVTQIEATKIIIATGSKPATLPGVVLDKKRIISSTEALALKEQPKKLVIIGGGVIGVEMASIFNRIGSEVTIIEYAPSLLPTMDRELGKALHKILKKENIDILLEQSVYQVENLGDHVALKFRDNQGKEQQVEADYVLMAVGRRPYTTGLGLANTTVTLDSRGFIETNAQLQTNAPTIFAIGDVIGGAMLAHKAEEEAVFVVETINGQKPHIQYNHIPSVVYTWPEVASVGATEEELKQKNIAYQVGKFPFAANARARASMDTEGFVKVLVDPKYGEVLGVHLIGARAADLIAQAVVALEYEVTAKDMFSLSYAHPTFSEVFKDAYRLAFGQPSINI